jgi:hypothetical protein
MIAALFYLFTGSIGGSIAVIAAGILIDIDHVIDCLFLYKKLDIKKIMDNKNHGLYHDKVIVSLHSIELVILLPLIFWFNLIAIGISLGMLTHMLSDFFYYRKTRQKSILSLFFIYRLSKRFSVNKLCNQVKKR